MKVILAGLLLLAGCVGPEGNNTVKGEGGVVVYHDDFVRVTRFTDAEQNTTCYISSSGGIWCTRSTP